MSTRTTFYRYILSFQAYSWIAIVVIPVNSLINPLLYTVSTEEFRSSISAFLVKQTQRVSRALNKCCGDRVTAADEIEMGSRRDMNN